MADIIDNYVTLVEAMPLPNQMTVQQFGLIMPDILNNPELVYHCYGKEDADIYRTPLYAPRNPGLVAGHCLSAIGTLAVLLQNGRITDSSQMYLGLEKPDEKRRVPHTIGDVCLENGEDLFVDSTCPGQIAQMRIMPFDRERANRKYTFSQQPIVRGGSLDELRYHVNRVTINIPEYGNRRRRR